MTENEETKPSEESTATGDQQQNDENPSADQPETTSPEEQATSTGPKLQNVMVTGATGFVGRHVVRELLARGLTPVCIVRDREKLLGQHPEIHADRIVPITGTLRNQSALQEAADLSQAVIHLVGIIIERKLRGQTFEAVHVRGTEAVLEATLSAGITRYVHMSALGSSPDGVSEYQRTKARAEQLVVDSGLGWTIFRPSLIHGADGEFMQLMKAFMCDLFPPVAPYFGPGTAKVQPVHVKDVAYCFAEALFRDDTIHQVYPLGGPRKYSWVGMYNACRAQMHCARRWKPIVSLPVPLAKVAAVLNGPPAAIGERIFPSTAKFRFDTGQVDMAQQDNVCDHTIAEKAFDTKMRDFEEELAVYADRIR